MIFIYFFIWVFVMIAALGIITILEKISSRLVDIDSVLLSILKELRSPSFNEEEQIISQLRDVNDNLRWLNPNYAKKIG